MIYFIRDAASGLVKIGFSAKPATRFSKIQSDCPTALEFVAVMDGALDDEQALHVRFAHLRVRGEWFREAPDLREVMDSAVAAGGAPRRRRPSPFSQKEFAVLAGISGPYASQILSGKKTPALPTLVSIFERTGVRLGRLRGASDDDLAALVGLFARLRNSHSGAAAGAA